MAITRELHIEPFYFSIFLRQFYNYFIKAGKYYKIFIYLFFINKFLKKKNLKIFCLIKFIIIEYYFSVDTRSKPLKRRKKIAKKFKRKRRRKKYTGDINKLFYLKLISFPQKKMFTNLKKFYNTFLLKKSIFFLSKLYNSYIYFFFRRFKSNPIKRNFLKRKFGTTKLYLELKRRKRFKADTRLNLKSLKKLKHYNYCSITRLLNAASIKLNRIIFLKFELETSILGKEKSISGKLPKKQGRILLRQDYLLLLRHISEINKKRRNYLEIIKNRKLELKKIIPKILKLKKKKTN